MSSSSGWLRDPSLAPVPALDPYPGIALLLVSLHSLTNLLHLSSPVPDPDSCFFAREESGREHGLEVKRLQPPQAPGPASVEFGGMFLFRSVAVPDPVSALPLPTDCGASCSLRGRENMSHVPVPSRFMLVFQQPMCVQFVCSCLCAHPCALPCCTIRWRMTTILMDVIHMFGLKTVSFVAGARLFFDRTTLVYNVDYCHPGKTPKSELPSKKCLCLRSIYSVKRNISRKMYVGALVFFIFHHLS